MLNVRMLRLCAALAVLGVLMTACGQKAGVHVAFGPAGTAAAPGTTTAPTFTDTNNDGLDDTTGQTAAEVAATTGTTTTTTTPGGTTPTGTTPGTSGTTTPATGGTNTPAGTPSGSNNGTPSGNNDGDNGGTTNNGNNDGNSGQTPSGGTTTGVTDTEIKIGLHAPLSGAAPLPQSSFASGKDQYWNQLGKVAGRNVRVFVKNDEYNPSKAATVCKELIEEEEVFILVGGGGADQIAACARTAAQYGVPYLSAGVDEGVLRQLYNYYALSMSYVQQAPIVMQYVQKHAAPSNGRFAILRDRTPSFNNVVDEMTRQAEAAGYEVLIRQIQNGPSDAQWLTANQIETAFPIMAPNAFVQILANPGGATPHWVGVGITMGLNTVAKAACETSGGRFNGMFLSPFPGLDAINQMDPKFQQAADNEGDDIELALWGLNKTIHQALKKVENNLTREAFLEAMKGGLSSGVYPDLQHSDSNHFGATSAHALQPKCSGGGNGQYVTLKTFVKGF